MSTEHTALTQPAVVRFLRELMSVVGMLNADDMVLMGLMSLCWYAEATGLDMPAIVKRMLEALSEEARARPNQGDVDAQG